MQRTYTDEQLEHIDDGLGCDFDGKHCTAYEATQMQRRLERTIRKQKRLRDAYKAAGLEEDAQAANIKLRRLNAKYEEFSKASGVPEQKERFKVLYTDDKLKAAAESLKVQRNAEAPIRADIIICKLYGYDYDFDDDGNEFLEFDVENELGLIASLTEDEILRIEVLSNG